MATPGRPAGGEWPVWASIRCSLSYNKSPESLSLVSRCSKKMQHGMADGFGPASHPRNPVTASMPRQNMLDAVLVRSPLVLLSCKVLFAWYPYPYPYFEVSHSTPLSHTSISISFPLCKGDRIETTCETNQPLEM